jgi:thymidine kinase
MSVRPKGSLEVIYGSMFAGKTEELVRRLRRLTIAKKESLLFKSTRDTRRGPNELSLHDGNIVIPCRSILDASEIYNYLGKDTHTVAIDECQFFNNNIIPVVVDLARSYRVICVGLNIDHLQKPYHPIPFLISLADKATHLKAICDFCGEEEAIFSIRKNNSAQQYLVGGKEEYNVFCRPCLNK